MKSSADEYWAVIPTTKMGEGIFMERLMATLTAKKIAEGDVEKTALNVAGDARFGAVLVALFFFGWDCRRA